MLKKLQIAVHRTGIFDEYTVHGLLYLFEGTREQAWHITAYSLGSKVNDYWVVGEEFHAVSMHYLYRMTDETRIEVHGVIQDVPDNLRRIALEAIRKWSEPFQDGILAP